MRRTFQIIATCLLAISPFAFAEEAEKAPDVLTEYMDLVELVDALGVYNTQLDTLLQNQQDEIGTLTSSIDQVDTIERQLGPLTERMIGTLELFINLDLPFRKEQRLARVAQLRASLDRSDISTAEKFRLALQAYSTELEYGNDRETYSDQIEVDGKLLIVDVLRWGRVVLAFQTADGATTGVWDNSARQWRVIDPSARDGVRDALRMTRGTMTENIVVLPTPAPGG